MTPVDDKVLWVENCWLGYFISFVLFFATETTVLYSQVNIIPVFLVSRFEAYGGFLFRTCSNTQIHKTHA